jgi:hypothetical protein
LIYIFPYIRKKKKEETENLGKMKLVCRKISGRRKAFWYIGRGGQRRFTSIYGKET